MSKRFCSVCGKELNEEARFCQNCGSDQSISPGPSAPSNLKVQKKRWPLFLGLGIGLVLVAGLILLITGVINFGSPAPDFPSADLIGSWSGDVTLDTVLGNGSEAEELRTHIGDTNSIRMVLTLNAVGVGGAIIDGDAVDAQLNGSTLKLDGNLGTQGVFNATGSITKNNDEYIYAGTYSINRSGITAQGKINLTLPITANPTATQTASETNNSTDSVDDPSSGTASPTYSDDGTAGIALENIWIYEDDGGLIMYTFETDGTYTRYFSDYVSDSSITEDGTYEASEDIIYLMPYDADSYEIGYEIWGTNLNLTYGDETETFDLYTP